MEETRDKLRPEEQAPRAGTAVSGKKALPSQPGGPGAVQVTDAKGFITREEHRPKKHAPGALKRGDSVWYRGERFWIEYAPSDWLRSTFVRICDKPIHPDRERPTPVELAYAQVGSKDIKGADFSAFCVHPDLLDLAPQAKNIHAPQPTLAGLARAERAAKGERDVGDEVAVKLRACKSLDEVYAAGADFLGVAEAELRAKYAHLNPGQQRMNIGNRMRAKWRKDNGH